ncbi:MAG: NADH-ubiquinone oxidoreductase-F iron-sulfur binding region domain-containing protein [Lachnospiraceae bacterium]|nr:NADH-ubiquinone oxidoreductase-F iron-sulfur binding region domain-containing protein [Lachnospiraceae bacterium]
MINNREELTAAVASAKEQIKQYDCRILVCSGTGCIASGSEKVYEEFVKIVGETPGVTLTFEPHDGEKKLGVKKTGCQGVCELGPLVRIQKGDQVVQYTKVQIADCQKIFEQTVLGDEVIEALLYKQSGISYKAPDEIPFIAKQTRIVLENCGKYDAESFDEYLAGGGFSALQKALFEMTPAEVVDEVDKSGLRGRGGGGFPTGRKWKQVARQKETCRYVVCNGDEGDPGAFMDGSVMEGDPYKLIEGMMIAGYACGAENGYIYVRAEYPMSVARLRHAIAELESRNLLGENILGTGFNFYMHINRGAGAFVCGEGSALTASIEGNRGMPRVKPPRTVEKGLWEKPTVLNNVETYANVPRIILQGSEWFRSIGTESSSGCKTFSLTGSIQNTGLIEVPMGTTLREIIFDIGGGLKDGGTFKAVQIGGPSGGCLTETELDVPLDFESVKKYGAIIGSGGLVVMDDNTCMVEVARFFMSFTQRESCGKCVPCREGTKRMLEIMERIVAGKGEMEDLDRLEELATMIKSTALCGLGKSAPLPVLSTLKMFREEYIEHIVDHKCKAKVCEAMKKFVINPEVCKGCSKCAKNCPVNAISGVVKKPFTIDPNVCIHCGACKENCAFDAIYIED